jgi:hypothetical protein
VFDDYVLKWFERNGLQKPEHIPHGKQADLEARLVPATVSSWRLEGNQLIAETNYGPHVQTIPTDYILVGTDENNLPVLKKISI